MDAGINNVIYMELHSGPKMANGTCGKTIVAGTIDRGSTVVIKNTATNWNEELVNKYELLSKICCRAKVMLWSLCSVVGITTRLKAGW